MAHTLGWISAGCNGALGPTDPFTAALRQLRHRERAAIGGDIVIIDGFRGVVMIDPDERTLASPCDGRVQVHGEVQASRGSMS